MPTSEKRVGKLEEQLQRWGCKLDELVTEAEQFDASAKAEYHDHVENLRELHRTMALKVAQFRADGGEKWDGFLAGIESSWTELESAFQALKRPSKRHSIH